MDPKLVDILDFLGTLGLGAVLLAIVHWLRDRKKIAAEAHKTDEEAEDVERGGVIAAAERLQSLYETRIKNLNARVERQSRHLEELEAKMIGLATAQLDMKKALAEKESLIKQMEHEKVCQQTEIERLQAANTSLSEKVRLQELTIASQATEISQLRREVDVLKAGKCVS